MTDAVLSPEAIEAWDTLQHSAIVVDRSDRRRVLLGGDRCAEVLNGMITNDVTALKPGDGLYAAALTPKGKIIADLRVFRLADGVLLDTGPRAGDGLWGVLRKYVNPRTASYTDVTGTLGEAGVFGPRSAEVVAAVAGLSVDEVQSLADYGTVLATWSGTGLTIARVPDLLRPGFALFVSAALQDSLVGQLVEAGGRVVPAATFECARVEAGRPEWGIDMDESTLAQEANLEELNGVSFTKGCYTGQETVARVHFRGHVNKLLRALRFEARAEIVRGSTLHVVGDDASVGDVRSVTISPTKGGVAIAMVRREVEAGTEVDVRTGDQRARATVERLPYQTA